MSGSESGAADDNPALEELVGLLREQGVTEDDIDRSINDDTIELLTIDKLMALEPPTLSLNDMAEIDGLDMELRGRMWRAMGLPDPDPDSKMFSPSDVEMAQLVQAMSEINVDDTVRLLQIVRVLGTSMARIAEAQVGAIEAARQRRQDLIADGADEAELTGGFGTDVLLEGMPRIMDFTWRLHLRAAARRRMALRSSGITDELTVGFVDLVDFTRLSEALEEDELVNLVDSFEADAFDAVTSHGGQVVKTIGDAVMFSLRDTPAAAHLAIELVTHYAENHDITDVRVGLATGPVTEKEGDLFGPTVNLASRLTGVAYPGAVVVSETTAKELTNDADFAFSKIPAQNLKGIGRRVSYRIRHAADEVPEGEDELARRRRRRDRRHKAS